MFLSPGRQIIGKNATVGASTDSGRAGNNFYRSVRDVQMSEVLSAASSLRAGRLQISQGKRSCSGKRSVPVRSGIDCSDKLFANIMGEP